MILMAHPQGFEPRTPRFVVWCSIQLSYGCGGVALASPSLAIKPIGAGIARCLRPDVVWARHLSIGAGGLHRRENAPGDGARQAIRGDGAEAR